MGGDGTMHAVVAALLTSGRLADTPVALVPLGTGNDFARGLGIPLDPVEAAQQLLTVSPRPLDLVVDDEGGVVVNAVHVGVGVEAAVEAHGLKSRYGRFGYVLGAVRTGFVTPGLFLRVVVDGEVVTDGGVRVLQVAIGNGRFVAGGVPLLPAAVADDGRVDVVVSFAMSTPRRFVYALGPDWGCIRTTPTSQRSVAVGCMSSPRTAFVGTPTARCAGRRDASGTYSRTPGPCWCRHRTASAGSPTAARHVNVAYRRFTCVARHVKGPAAT